MLRPAGRLSIGTVIEQMDGVVAGGASAAWRPFSLAAGGSVVVRAAEDVLDELGDPESTAAGEGYEEPVLEF